MSGVFSVSVTLGDLADGGRRGAAAGLSSRVNLETALPIDTVRQLRPHAARRGTTVPLLALEIVEAAVDLGCVADLLAARAMPAACERPAARFALGYVVAVQLRAAAPECGGRMELLARAVVEAALDQGRVDRLLVGRFDRGDARSAKRLAAPPQLPPSPPPAAATLLPSAPVLKPDPVSTAVARWVEQAPKAAFAPARWRMILAEVSTGHGLHIDDLVGPDRKGPVATARFEAAYRLWRELGWSLPEVGRRLGGRDHTSALYGIRKHAARHGLPLEQIRRAPAAEVIVAETPATSAPIEPTLPVQIARAEPASLPPQARRPVRRRPARRLIAAILADAAAGYRALRARP